MGQKFYGKQPRAIKKLVLLILALYFTISMAGAPLLVSGNGSSCLLRFLGIFFLRIVVGGQFGNFRLLQQPCLCSGGKIECENDQKKIFSVDQREQEKYGVT